LTAKTGPHHASSKLSCSLSYEVRFPADRSIASILKKLRDATRVNDVVISKTIRRRGAIEDEI
jgi:hypothetical protein